MTQRGRFSSTKSLSPLCHFFVVVSDENDGILAILDLAVESLQLGAVAMIIIVTFYSRIFTYDNVHINTCNLVIAVNTRFAVIGY